MNSPARIIIVEDDSLIALDIQQALTGFGYEVVAIIDNSEEALKKIPPLKPDFILMDINIKGSLDGIETTRQLHKLGNYPVVFLTGNTDEETLQRAKLTQPYGYLIKPFDAQELRSNIELTLYRFKEEHPQDIRTVHEDSLEEAYLAEAGEDKLAILQRHSIFANASPELLKNLASECSIKSLDTGEFIVHEGEKSKGGFIPLSGRLSVTKSSSNGKELIVSLLSAGDPFGIFYILENFSGTTAVRAQVPSKILWIPKSSFAHFMSKDISVTSHLCEVLSKHLVNSHLLSSSLAHTKVEDRIVKTLLALLPQFGKGKDTPQIRIYITRRELADLTGTTPETAIRVTKNLEREGYLDLSRPGIIKILNKEKLDKFAEGL
jgi:CRP-like cAMP-binding protein/FixJ family two-component response regulator